MTEPRSPHTLRLAATGDLLLTSAYAAKTPGRGLESLCPQINALFSTCDIVLANLECTLSATPQVASEPRVFTTPAQLESLRTAHINLVTQANNHTFDAFDQGFEKTVSKLASLGIKTFGAGYNLDQAMAPATFICNGIRIAVFAAVTPSTGMQLFARANASGVAPFDVEKICATIQELKAHHDHVIFVPHWGEERFRFPSPEQIEQAHRFIDAGASAVLGHHPHVIQGSEHYHGGFISYSLGNFLTNNVYWENGDTLTWNNFERSSKIIILEFNQHEIKHVEQIPTFDNGTQVKLDKKRRGKRLHEKADHYLRQGITASAYRKEKYRVQSILPIVQQLTWRKLRKIRLGQVKKALKLLTGQKH